MTSIIWLKMRLFHLWSRLHGSEYIRFSSIINVNICQLKANIEILQFFDNRQIYEFLLRLLFKIFHWFQLKTFQGLKWGDFDWGSFKGAFGRRGSKISDLEWAKPCQFPDRGRKSRFSWDILYEITFCSEVLKGFGYPFFIKKLLNKT